MPNSKGVAVRVLIVVAGSIAALFIADYISLRVLGLFVAPDAQGRYTVDYVKGHGYAVAISTFANAAVLLLFVTLIFRIVYARRPVDRIVVLAGGYATACVAAAAVLIASVAIFVYPALSPGSPTSGAITKGALEQFASLVRVILMLGAAIGFFALIPSLPVILRTERKQIRRMSFYAVAGALTGIVSFALYLTLMSSSLWWPWLTGAPRTASPSISASWPEAIRIVLGWFLMFVLPGLGGGLTYWLIAGRRAGAGREPAASSTPTAEPQAG